MTDDIQKYKIIFLGDQGVGKSSILNRFSQDKFEQEYQATIGLDFHSKNATINGANIRLLLYDTAGQEKFKSLIPMYIRDANIIIVVYDITIKDSFTHTSHWVNETKDLKREDAIFVLVGNKIDLNDKRQVSSQEGQNYANEKEFIFFEVSARTGQGIQELFNNNIFPEMVKKFKIVGDDDDLYKTNEQKTDNDEMNGVKLDSTEKKKKKGCCGGKGKNQKKKEDNNNIPDVSPNES
jgi:Ras-related protein Rab-6A